MKKIFLSLFCLLFLCACGTKRQYFEPKEINGDLSYDQHLNSKIIDWNLFSAKLSNRQTIAKDQGLIENFKLPKNYILLAYKDSEFVIADNNGNLKILDNNLKEIYTSHFDATVLSVALDGDDIAMVLANNTIMLVNRSLGTIFSQTLTPSVGQDNRIAAPIFLDNIVIYPSLDGKILVLARTSHQIVKDVVVSAENFFNNVIFLKVINDKMIASTAKRVIIVSPARTVYLDAEIKDIIPSNDNSLFILEKDGNIIKTDLNLRKITEKKFDFAIFTKATVSNDKLYVFEKTGYLIQSDFDLNDFKIYKLNSAVDQMSFINDDNFYYDNKILKLK